MTTRPGSCWLVTGLPLSRLSTPKWSFECELRSDDWRYDIAVKSKSFHLCIICRDVVTQDLAFTPKRQDRYEILQKKRHRTVLQPSGPSPTCKTQVFRINYIHTRLLPWPFGLYIGISVYYEAAGSQWTEPHFKYHLHYFNFYKLLRKAALKILLEINNGLYHEPL